MQVCACRNVQSLAEDFAAELAAAQGLCVSAGITLADWPVLPEEPSGADVQEAAAAAAALVQEAAAQMLPSGVCFWHHVSSCQGVYGNSTKLPARTQNRS